jgi:hypothetical protein
MRRASYNEKLRQKEKRGRTDTKNEVVWEY